MNALASTAEEPPARIALIGVPTDIGAGTRGTGMGPDALRVARLGEAIAQLAGPVLDLGNLAGPANPQRPRDGGGFRHLDECVQWNQGVHDAVHAQLQAGRMPVMLGGDHSLAIGSISAVARHCRAAGKQLRVVWLDAHADFNTASISPTGNIHGMPVACLCGHGPAELTGLAGHVPALAPADIRQIGIRSVDEEEKRMVNELGVEVFDMRFIDETGMRATLQQALRGLEDPGIHLHLSFDVDFLDPEIAPGTGTTVRGGPTYREAQLCMEMIADTGRLGSLDIVELNPALDVRNQTAGLVVDLVESLFGKSTLVRNRGT
ncbi:arginase [Ramlibacter sp. H39-3-26]|uniref:arginase n=1 Tax=Curvibacter soli TaxID=3031331 RepID=UPI0023DB1CED|nr:arginase [Ramlibacter sp. H39-3-26]MDF1484544.1 arginase [Ramlibacter sp. H39-3-26]